MTAGTSLYPDPVWQKNHLTRIPAKAFEKLEGSYYSEVSICEMAQSRDPTPKQNKTEGKQGFNSHTPQSLYTLVFKHYLHPFHSIQTLQDLCGKW